jgi:hypothetical protein
MLRTVTLCSSRRRRAPQAPCCGKDLCIQLVPGSTVLPRTVVGSRPKCGRSAPQAAIAPPSQHRTWTMFMVGQGDDADQTVRSLHPAAKHLRVGMKRSITSPLGPAARAARDIAVGRTRVLAKERGENSGESSTAQIALGRQSTGFRPRPVRDCATLQNGRLLYSLSNRRASCCLGNSQRPSDLGRASSCPWILMTPSD